MNQFLSNKIIAGIVAVALLVGVGVLVSSGDTSSTTRNAALVVATPCTKPGQVTKVSKQSVVCATTNTGSLWYATMKAKGKAQACTKPGAIRKKSDIVWVCGVIKKKKIWQATQPLTALAAKGDLPSTTPATPDAPVVADNAVLAGPQIPDDKTATQAIDTAATQTLAPAVPAALSLETQPSGGVNALALETQPVVQLLDQRGASISTAGITITAVSGRTDVVLSGNTAITDGTGRATFTTLSLTGIMGDITLTFTAPNLEGITSDKFVLTAGAATNLVNSATIGSVVSGKAFDQQPVLHFEDSSANVIAASGVDVIVTSSIQGLSGATTVATNKKGVAGFTDLALTQAGATTLTFTSGELSTTADVTVVAGDYTTVKITTEASQEATNNTAFSQSPVVQLVDANNNNVTTKDITVTVTITQFPTADTDKVATVLISTATTDAQGLATFTGLGIKGLIGKYTLGYTPTNGETQASEKTTTLSASDPTQLIVLTIAAGPEGNSEAGTWSLTQRPVIGLRDISNNPVTTSDVIVTAEVGGNAADVTGKIPTFSAQTDAQGKAEIPITFNGASAGDRTIRYSALRLRATSAITLPILTPVVQAWVLPTDKTTTSPVFTLTPPSSNSNAQWVFAGFGGAFATLERLSGRVTPLGVAGTVTITAMQPATTKYRSVELLANLVIALTPAVVSPAWVLPTDKTTTSQAFTLIAPVSNSNAPWTYASSNSMIATITTTGAVTLKGIAGRTVVTATQAATTKYASTTSEATLTIAFTTPTVTWALPKRIKSSAPFTLTAPTSNSNAPWTYASSNATIATISTAGIVTLTGVAGTTIITATQAATTKFASATTTSNLVATDGYNIGDVGPGGGKVFYDAGISQSWGRYLEAAPTDFQVNGSRAGIQWGCQGTFTGATATAIGTGKANTAMILTKCTLAGVAADVANKYSTSTAAAGQWFLPSLDELNELCKMYSNGRTDTTQYANMQNGCTGNSSPTGGFVADIYWSSSESNASYVLHQSFLNGYQSNITKSTNFYVRPVRAFSATCAMGGPCAVGDVGPGGGTVFYDAGSKQLWGRYLEAAPTDYQVNDSGKEVEWGCSSTGTGVGAGATAIGTGKTNTAKIIANCTTPGIAADAANKYFTSTAGAGQWFLPSKDELHAMWTNKDAIGGFVDDDYWSSSENPPYAGWFEDFQGGQKYAGGKYWARFVRPVRAF